jgi:hypothetical protein
VGVSVVVWVGEAVGAAAGVAAAVWVDGRAESIEEAARGSAGGLEAGRFEAGRFAGALSSWRRRQKFRSRRPILSSRMLQKIRTRTKTARIDVKMTYSMVSQFCYASTLSSR